MKGNLFHFEQQFKQVGWFIPPFVQMGGLSIIAQEIERSNGSLSQNQLGSLLALVYNEDALASMVLHRYPHAPVISDFRCTIGESVEAHFSGLSHIAVAGLIPVIEGAGRRLAFERGLKYRKAVCTVLEGLAKDCKEEAVLKNFGEPFEIASMMDSFSFWVRNHFYVESRNYTLSDRTNRHGISHGQYTDSDYGRPINFYKVIAAVDFLTFIASFRSKLSWLSPNRTAQSAELATYFRTLPVLRLAKEGSANKGDVTAGKCARS